MPILVRAGVLILLDLLLHVVDAVTGSADANIGLGILWFAGCLVVSGVWAHRDVRFGRSLRDAIILWTAVAAAVGLCAAVIGQIFGPDDIDLGVFLSDLIGFLPLVVFIVLLPATIGGLLGERARRE